MRSSFKHFISRMHIGLPLPTGLDIVWSQFPLFVWIRESLFKAFELLVFVDGQKNLNEVNTVRNQHFFELTNFAVSFFEAMFRCEFANFFSKHSPIPRAIKNREGSRGWQTIPKAIKIVLPLLVSLWGPNGMHMKATRI